MLSVPKSRSAISPIACDKNDMQVSPSCVKEHKSYVNFFPVNLLLFHRFRNKLLYSPLMAFSAARARSKPSYEQMGINATVTMQLNHDPTLTPSRLIASALPLPVGIGHTGIENALAASGRL